MYYSPLIRYDSRLAKSFRNGIYLGLTVGGCIGVLAGYLLKMYGG